MKFVLRLSVMASAGLVSLTVAAHAQQAPNMTFFVTSTSLNDGGNLGGMEGADRHCQALAAAVGAGGKTWRAYLSTSGAQAVSARDRIGNGPWQNSKGEVIAQNVNDLHSDNAKLNQQTVLTERGTQVSGFGMTPNIHDALTGSQMDGKAFPANLNLTCGNWTSNNFGKAMLGHTDRKGPADHVYMRSWNASHQSRGCSQADLVATGGGGLFYCFAAN